MNIMREAIFQILFHMYLNNKDIGQIKFLDLFTGSGLMAIEAVSRGVGHAVCVELDPQKWSVIQENITIAKQDIKSESSDGIKTSIHEHSNRIYLAKSPAEKFLLKNNKVFDIIYVDPPFNYKYKNDLLQRIIKSRACSTNTIIIMHSPKKEQVIKKYEDFVCIDQRNYGGSAVYFFGSNKNSS